MLIREGPGCRREGGEPEEKAITSPFLQSYAMLSVQPVFIYIYMYVFAWCVCELHLRGMRGKAVKGEIL